MDRSAVVHRRPADRIPKVLVCRDRLHGWKISSDVGRVSRGRQEAEGKGTAHRSNAGSHLRRCARVHLPLPVVLGRQRGRSRRQDSCAEQPATVESVKFMVAFWKDAHDEGGLAWDDSNNNRAFLSGTCSATLNGASIYIEALRKADTYKTEAGGQLKDDILHAALPKGPGGQFSYYVPF